MAVKSSKVSVATRRSKAEVQQEFEKIQEQVEAEQQLKDVKTEGLTRLREAEARQTASGITVESVAQRIPAMGVEVSRALADISEKLMHEVKLLGAVQEAVALEQKELERLHKIDIAATAIDQMVQEYGRDKQRLESEIAAQRETWEQESAQYERDRKEQEETLKKQRQREMEDYEYKKVLERKKAQDKYDEEVRLTEKNNHERQEALEKGWQQREGTLKEREEELARLRKEVQEFPARLQAETQSAAAQTRKEVEGKVEQQILLLKKDAETEKRLSALQVKTLEEIVARQAAQITTLEQQLGQAKQQVQDIAVKAIEGASGAKALSHINQIAMEQAKNRPQS